MKITHALFLTLTLCISSAQATLVKTDFLNPNDGLIVKDTVTQFEWLTPLYTKGQEYNSPFIQSLISNHGFRYATAQEATSMIVNNFGIVTTTAPGDAAGYTAANSYISLFGVSGSGQVFSPGGNGPTFQRMLGLTSTLAPGYSNWYQAFGMQSTSNGLGFAWMGLQDPGFNGTFTNGSYLIRPSADSSVPEPSTTAFLLLGLSLLAASKTVRRNL